MIKVRLFVTLREGRKKVQMLSTSDLSTTGDAIHDLNIPVEEVVLFPPVGGG